MSRFLNDFTAIVGASAVLLAVKVIASADATPEGAMFGGMSGEMDLGILPLTAPRPISADFAWKPVAFSLESPLNPLNWANPDWTNPAIIRSGSYSPLRGGFSGIHAVPAWRASFEAPSRAGLHPGVFETPGYGQIIDSWVATGRAVETARNSD